ncbi:MAG: DUF1080 domain-containing protein [Sphingobacteriales bacterium]|nr:MAG: DUF1080 domain-containing protein [Sphingobacteriales bacterium]
MNHKIILSALLAAGSFTACAQNAKPEDTEIWQPEPKVVTAGKTVGDVPSDAIVLFDGKNLNEWVSSNDHTKPSGWPVADGVFTVNKGPLGGGGIITKRTFTNYQLHVEWRVPANITGSGQVRGNSGIFLASTGFGDSGYELQVLDSYKNKTYVNGMAGSIYKQFAPLANAVKQPGEWQVYDVIWTAPVFNEDGTVKSAAKVTVLLNGVLIQNNTELLGPTVYVGKPQYKKHGVAPIYIQSHGDPSEPLSFRNIWLREL